MANKHRSILIYICIQIALALVFFIGANSGLNQASAALKETLNDVTELSDELTEAEVIAEQTSPLAFPGSDGSGDINSSVEAISDKPENKVSNLKDGTYTGIGKGYGGLITLNVTVEDGAIKSIDIVSAPGETPAYFNLASAIVPNIISSGSAIVDGVSGATLSSNGIKAAAADAISQAGGAGDAAIEPVNVTTAKAYVKTDNVKYNKPDAGWKDGKYTGSATGFGGKVNVTVTIKNGKITNISANGPNETASYWSRALNVVSRIVKKQDPNVDSVSGATYSSNGIKNAVKRALNKAGYKDKNTKNDKSNDNNKESGDNENNNNNENDKGKTDGSDGKDNVNGSESDNGDRSVTWKDGKYTGNADGYGGNVKVTVTIKDGKITDIKATGKNETKEYWNKALKLIDKIIRKQTSKVDSVSGATLSSNGIKNAVTDALSKAQTSGRKDQIITTAEDIYLLDEGESADIGAKAKTELSYKSSDPSIVTVDETGMITGMSVGEATINITAKKTAKYNKATLKVSVIVFEADEEPLDPEDPSNTSDPSNPSDPSDTDDQGDLSDSNGSGQSDDPSDSDAAGNTSDTNGDAGSSDNSSTDNGNSSTGTKDTDPKDAGDSNNTGSTNDTNDTKDTDKSGNSDNSSTGSGTGKNTESPDNPKGGDDTPGTGDQTDPSETDKPGDNGGQNGGSDNTITGKFSGTGTGYGGKISASVDIENNSIKAITVDGPEETSKYWFKAQKITTRMIKQQTWDVDTVSGATISSNGIKQAVKQAIEEAGLK